MQFQNDVQRLIGGIGAAVSLVATRVAEINFAVLDDRGILVGNVDRSVQSHLHVDRAEGDVVGFESAVADSHEVKPVPSSLTR